MTALLIGTFVSTLVGLVFSIWSVIDAVRERREATHAEGLLLSELLEHKRHVLQQTFRTIKLLTLAAVLLVAIFERPENANTRSWVLRGLLIGVIFLIAVSAVHEKFAYRAIVRSIVEERLARYRQWAERRTTHTEG